MEKQLKFSGLLSKKHLFLFLAFLLFPIPVTIPSFPGENIYTQIKSLTPSYPLQSDLYDVETIGYDILNEAYQQLQSEELVFLPESQFYIDIFVKKKLANLTASKDFKLIDYVAYLDQKNNDSFKSALTTCLSGKNQVNEPPEIWQIGGLYKMRFHFKVPRSQSPGLYTLKISRRNSDYLKTQITIQIVGHVVLNEAQEPLDFNEYTFMPGSTFYIDFIGGKKVEKMAEATEDEYRDPHYYTAVLTNAKQDKFGSTFSSLEWDEKQDKKKEKKARFHFKVPSSAPPGKYRLGIVRESEIFLQANLFIDILNYYFLDQGNGRLDGDELSFPPGKAFYIVFQGGKKIEEIAEAIQDEQRGPHHYKALFVHENGYKFGSTLSSIEWDPEPREEGLEKVRFHFLIPSSAPPGKYFLAIIRGSEIHLRTSISLYIR